jgi:SAM-dependent methyltransferase
VTPTEGPPLPPRRLRVRVAGTTDADWFLRTGRADYDAIAAHVPLADVQALLDFGCGCGRVTRYFHDFAGEVSRSDVNAQAIDWCRGNLRFARFEVNGLAPPLLFADASFDLVYAYSVFTHLTAELQVAWRDELRRVLQPGGRLLVTTHGESYVARLDEDERARFNAGELVVRWARPSARISAAPTTPSGTYARPSPRASSSSSSSRTEHEEEYRASSFC